MKGNFPLTVSPLVSDCRSVPKPIQKLLAEMKENPSDVRFSDALKVATFFFGKPRRSGGSHHVFKMPWSGDPRINLQGDGKAKPYQVRQLLMAVEKCKCLVS
jgi:hypothetical protein